MKQYEAVIQALENFGGYATLGQLYQAVPIIPGCIWETKTPFASIRRIVQKRPEIFRVRPGLWALESKKEYVRSVFSNYEKKEEFHHEYSHSYYQGLIVEIGNFRDFQTYVPSQDKNKKFGAYTLSAKTTLPKMLDFTYQNVIGRAKTIDVSWFNARNFPNYFFEIEHSTNITNSLLKFLDLVDFRVKYHIVANSLRKKEYEGIICNSLYDPIRQFIRFWDYENVLDLHTKISQSYLLEKEMFS